MFGWVSLFLTQALLIRADYFAWHRRMGLIGAALAALIVPFSIATGLAILPRDLASMGEAGYSAFLPTGIEALLFGSLVSGAIALRSRLTVFPCMVAIYVVEVWGGGHPLFIAAARRVADFLS